VANDKYFTQIRNKLIRSGSLTPYDKAVLFVLMSYGSCEKIYLSQSEIAKQANMSRDMVHKTVKKLKEKRYINTVEQIDRATLEYKLLYKAVTDTISRVTDENDRGYGQERQGGTDENDTSNKSISNKSRVIKDIVEKKNALDDLVDKVILMWKEKSGQNKIQLTTKSYRKQIKTAIKDLALSEESDILSAFAFVFDNKGAQAADEEYRLFSQAAWNLTTLTRPANFMRYYEEPEHKSAEELDKEEAARVYNVIYGNNEGATRAN